MNKNELPLEKKQAINEYSRWMQQRRYADQTIKTYVSMLIVFFSHYPEKAIDKISLKDIEGTREAEEGKLFTTGNIKGGSFAVIRSG